MPRFARIVVAGVAHHVTQRGNNKQDVFFVDDDRRVYLELLRAQSQRFGLRVDGYCLMSNHVHIVGVPSEEDSLTKAIGRTNFLYTQYVNRLHGRSGHLWQNRFYSCPMDEAHAMNALCYIELNPVRAGTVRVPWTYPWSSAAAHCGKAPANLLLDVAAWRETMPAGEWRETLAAFARDANEADTLRRSTHSGRPLGSDSFMSKLENLLGRRLRPLPIGRQKGWRKKRDGEGKSDGGKRRESK
jgi:putative transposase